MSTNPAHRAPLHTRRRSVTKGERPRRPPPPRNSKQGKETIRPQYQPLHNRGTYKRPQRQHRNLQEPSPSAPVNTRKRRSQRTSARRTRPITILPVTKIRNLRNHHREHPNHSNQPHMRRPAVRRIQLHKRRRPQPHPFQLPTLQP